MRLSFRLSCAIPVLIDARSSTCHAVETPRENNAKTDTAHISPWPLGLAFAQLASNASTLAVSFLPLRLSGALVAPTLGT